VLFILEDFSGSTSTEREEEAELIRCNVIARVSATFETLVLRLSNCKLDQSSLEQEQYTTAGMALLNQCLVILCNMSTDSSDARKEI
jgi:hypothetical protein